MAVWSVCGVCSWLTIAVLGGVLIAVTAYQKQNLVSSLAPAVVIFAVVAAVSAIGGIATDSGMSWYRALSLPAITPPGSFIGIVWTLIYAMGGIAAYLIWLRRSDSRYPRLLVALVVANAILNALWTWLFFGLHWIGVAVFEMVLLNLTNLAIILICWRRIRLASYLFMPYFAWVCFATYLAASIWRLNH